MDRLRAIAIWSPGAGASEASLRLGLAAVRLGPVLVLVALWIAMSLVDMVSHIPHH